MNLRECDTTGKELLDASDVDSQLLRQSLRDFRRLGFVLGWISLAVKDVAWVVTRHRLRAFSALDVATGAANVSITLACWACRQQLQAEITANDLSDQVLAVAQTECASFPEIRSTGSYLAALMISSQAF